MLSALSFMMLQLVLIPFNREKELAAENSPIKTIWEASRAPSLQHEKSLMIVCELCWVLLYMVWYMVHGIVHNLNVY